MTNLNSLDELLPEAIITVIFTLTFFIKVIIDKSINHKYVLKINEIESRNEKERLLLQNEFSLKLEKLKQEAQKEIILFNIRNSELQKKRADVIENLYEKIELMHKEALRYYNEPSTTEHPWKYCLEVEANFRKVELYVSENLDQKFRELIDKYLKMSGYTDLRIAYDKSGNIEEWTKKNQEIADLFLGEIPRLKKEIKSEFRDILGVN